MHLESSISLKGRGAELQDGNSWVCVYFESTNGSRLTSNSVDVKQASQFDAITQHCCSPTSTSASAVTIAVGGEWFTEGELSECRHEQ